MIEHIQRLITSIAERVGTQGAAYGVTTFLYDSFGSLTNETVVGIAGTNTIERFWDDFGRTAGYAFNGIRQTTIGYEPDKGRISTMGIENLHSTTTTNLYNCFKWTYLDGSDLKSSLTYPNGLTASWQYDANSQLLQVCNATPTNVISQYDYTYDPAGRRIAIGRSGSAMSETRTDEYGYNIRGELISAAKNAEGAKVIEYQYAYDDIGNRISSYDIGTNRTYTANNLNQYTQVSNLCDSASLREEFIPQFDNDGNQTLIQTATGIWQVTYNGENRPVVWQCVSTNSPTHNSSTSSLIMMSYDRMGRRVTKNNQRFVYDGYLQIANSELKTLNTKLQTFIWDPTEPIATRPLAWLVLRSLGEGGYYTHDGNKNVSEVVEENGDIAARYDYAPFGAVIAQRGASAAVNPWRYSSEYADDYISLSYYNYRHYNFACGRWLCRDMLEEQGGVNLYAYPNNPITNFDVLGYSQHGCNNVGYTEFQGMSDDEIRKRHKALSMKGRRTPYEKQLLAKLKTEEKAREIRRSRLSLRASSCRRGFVSPWGMAANLICSFLIAELSRVFTQQIDVPPKSNPIAKSASCEKKDDGYWLCECDTGYTAWGAGDLSCKRFKNRPLIMCIQDLAEMPIDVAIALISNNSKQSNYNEQCPCRKEYDCE